MRMPVSGYGTRVSPGHIALWLISLGSQKGAIQQWLGKDDLTKYKAIEPAVKFIRTNSWRHVLKVKPVKTLTPN